MMGMEGDMDIEGYEKEQTSDSYIPLLLLLSLQQQKTHSMGKANPLLFESFLHSTSESAEPIHEQYIDKNIVLDLYYSRKIKLNEKEYEEARH